MCGLLHRPIPLSGDFRNNDYVIFDLYYFSYILYNLGEYMKLVKKLLGNKVFQQWHIESTKNVMQEVLKEAGLISNVPQTVEANGQTYVLQGYQQKAQTQAEIPELSSQKDKDLDEAETKLVKMMTDNPTAGLVIVKTNRGKSRMVDMITKRLATVFELKENRKPWNTNV